MQRKTSHNIFTFFYNQKISAKILDGYLVILLLAVIIGGLSIYHLTQVNSTIKQLSSQLIWERELAENMAVKLYHIRLSANKYIFQGQTPVDLKSYEQATSDAQFILRETENSIMKEGRSELWIQIRKNLLDFSTAFAEIVQIMSTRQNTIDKVLAPQSAFTVEKLTILRNNGFKSMNFTEVFYTSQVFSAFSRMQADVPQYLTTGNDQYATNVDYYYLIISSSFDHLQTSKDDRATGELIDEINDSIAKYYEGFKTVEVGMTRQHDLLTNRIGIFGDEMDREAILITKETNDEFFAQSESISKLVGQTFLWMLFSVLSIIVVGLFFSLMLSRIITRPIEQVAHAARDVARGSFDQQIEVLGNDELGILTEAFNDMTVRVRDMMATLNESKERYLTLFETSNDALYLMDEDVCIECNQKAVEMLNCSNKSEIIGRPLQDYSPDLQSDGCNSGEKIKQLILAALRGVPQFFYWQYQRKDLTLMDAEVSLNYLNIRGKSYLQFIVRDITERKLAEEEAHRQMARSESLVRIAARLNASLDLNTLLGAVCAESATSTHAPAAWIDLFNPTLGMLSIASVYGLPPEFIQLYQPSSQIPYSDLIISKNEAIVVFSDVQQLTNIPNASLYASFDIRTVVNGIMMRDDQLIGVLSLNFAPYKSNKREQMSRKVSKSASCGG